MELPHEPEAVGDTTPGCCCCSNRCAEAASGSQTVFIQWPALSYRAFFSCFMPAESKKPIKENRVITPTSDSGPGNSGKDSLESCRMQTEEVCFFWCPSPGFTNCLSADESDCTEYKDDPWVSKVVEASSAHFSLLCSSNPALLCHTAFP